MTLLYAALRPLHPLPYKPPVGNAGTARLTGPVHPPRGGLAFSSRTWFLSHSTVTLGAMAWQFLAARPVSGIAR
jgi:hypothetical protein